MQLRPYVLVALLGCTVALSCKLRTPASGVKESASGETKLFREIFEALIGRPPNAAEMNLAAPSYEAMIDKILRSEVFRNEGFFFLHEDRLLLQKYESKEEWSRNAHLSYCALKQELSEVAQADADGRGYWEILRYRERYVPLRDKDELMRCMLSTTSGSLVEAQARRPDLPSMGAYPGITGESLEGGTGIPLQDLPDEGGGIEAAPVEEGNGDDGAGSCLRFLENLNRRFPGAFEEGEDSDLPVEAPPAKPAAPTTDDLTAFLGQLKKESAKNPKAPPIAFASGRAFFSKLMQRAVAGDKDLGPVEIIMQDGMPVIYAERSSDTFGTGCSLSLLRDGKEIDTKAANGYLIKVRVPPALAGVHASPFWLARHKTSETNRHLHRSRIVFHSYFCQDINPDAAQGGDGAARVHEELQPYFPPGDQHAFSSNTCYRCHATLQPLGNYFRGLSFGKDFTAEFQAPFDLDVGMTEPMEAADVPAGFWQWQSATTGSFFGKKGRHYATKGLEPFANLMSDPNFPRPAQCIVRHLWSSLFGNHQNMPDRWLAEAVREFQKANNGRGGLGDLARHMLVSRYGKAYFTSQDVSFEDMLAAEENMDCNEAVSAKGWADASRFCKECHEEFPKELQRDKRRRSTAYCKVLNDAMPEGPPPDWTLDFKSRVLCAMRHAGVDNERCATLPSSPDTAPHAM